MTTIAEVMEEMERRLGTIDGLRTFDHKPSTVAPPAAWVQLPDVDYDLTFQRGADKMLVPVLLVVASVTDRAWKTQLGGYLNPAGPMSVKAAVDGDFANGFFRVMRARSGSILLAGIEYWGSTFDVDVVV